MKYPQGKILKSITIMLLLVSFYPASIFADNISDTDKYAWSENSGWLNFKSTHQQVTVYDDHLQGYVWAENVGWIRLGTQTGGGAFTYLNNAANNYGVNNDGSGNLSGYGWGENIGWVNFNPTHAQVTINANTGDFNGYAWSENIGWIHFNNSVPAYKVTRELSTPNAFTFTDQTNVSRSSQITSNTITVSAININAVISITGGEYEINGNGTWTITNGVVVNGDTIKVRHNSSGSYSSSVNSVLTIANVSDTFTSTTGVAPVSTPTPSPTPNPTPNPTPAPEPIVTDNIGNARNLSSASNPAGGNTTVLDDLQGTISIIGNNNQVSITQDPQTSMVNLVVGDSQFSIRPVEVTLAPTGTPAGITVTSDGLVKMVTDSGVQITFTIEPLDADALEKVFTDAGFKVVRGANGELYIVPDSLTRSSNNIWFSSRMQPESIPVADSSDIRTGLVAITNERLANTVLYAQQFYQGDILYRQILSPTPADWDSLKALLKTLDAQVAIDLYGYITLTVDDVQYTLLMSYVVTTSSDTGATVRFNAVGDQNQDGNDDLEVVYPNGDKQIVYILP